MRRADHGGVPGFFRQSSHSTKSFEQVLNRVPVRASTAEVDKIRYLPIAWLSRDIHPSCGAPLKSATTGLPMLLPVPAA
jgi:hypothetical protein